MGTYDALGPEIKAAVVKLQGGTAMTTTQKKRQLSPFNLRKNKWFYLSLSRGVKGCSFHDGEENQHVHAIPVTALLRALEDTGILDLWDRKQRILRQP